MITEKVIQRWVNSLADRYSSKTIRNQVGLLTVVLHQNGINLNMKSITLKPKIKPEYNIPTETEIQKIALAVKHTTIEIPIIIALTLGLRQSEIAGLRWEHYDGTYLKIKCAVVPDENHKLVEKNENKSYAGRRIIEVPDYLKDILDNSENVSAHTVLTIYGNILIVYARKMEYHILLYTPCATLTPVPC